MPQEMTVKEFYDLISPMNYPEVFDGACDQIADMEPEQRLVILTDRNIAESAHSTFQTNSDRHQREVNSILAERPELTKDAFLADESHALYYLCNNGHSEWAAKKIDDIEDLKTQFDILGNLNGFHALVEYKNGEWMVEKIDSFAAAGLGSVVSEENNLDYNAVTKLLKHQSDWVLEQAYNNEEFRELTLTACDDIIATNGHSYGSNQKTRLKANAEYVQDQLNERFGLASEAKAPAPNAKGGAGGQPKNSQLIM